MLFTSLLQEFPVELLSHFLLIIGIGNLGSLFNSGLDLIVCPHGHLGSAYFTISFIFPQTTLKTGDELITTPLGPSNSLLYSKVYQNLYSKIY